jgi:hypothetical protein
MSITPTFQLFIVSFLSHIILDFFDGSREDLLDFHQNYNEKVQEMQGLGLE